jgi:hypothetical protein
MHETKSQIDFVIQVSDATHLNHILTSEFSVRSKKLPVFLPGSGGLGGLGGLYGWGGLGGLGGIGEMGR